MALGIQFVIPPFEIFLRHNVDHPVEEIEQTKRRGKHYSSGFINQRNTINMPSGMRVILSEICRKNSF